MRITDGGRNNVDINKLDMKVAEGLLCKHIRGGHPMYKLKDLDNYLLSAPIIGCAKEPLNFN